MAGYNFESAKKVTTLVCDVVEFSAVLCSNVFSGVFIIYNILYTPGFLNTVTTM